MALFHYFIVFKMLEERISNLEVNFVSSLFELNYFNIKGFKEFHDYLARFKSANLGNILKSLKQNLKYSLVHSFISILFGLFSPKSPQDDAVR